MQNLKTKTILFLAIIIFATANCVAVDCDPKSIKTGYELFEQRAKCHCTYVKGGDIGIYGTTKYGNLDKDIIKSASGKVVEFSPTFDGLEYAKELYKANMDGIYNCAMEIVNYRSSVRLEELVKNNPLLKKLVNSKEKAKQKSDTCISGNNEVTKDSLIKSAVLNKATNEFCTYNYYLEYLREYYKNVENVYKTKLSGTGNEISLTATVNLINNMQTNIDKEIADVDKIFPVIYQAYAEYEDNFVIHKLLELLREDYVAFREQLHKNLNPINQVVYKIANAMKAPK